MSACKRLFAAVGIVLAVTSAPSHAAVLIDNFTTFQGPLTRVVPGDFGTPISSTVDGGGIVGGERDILVQLTSAAGPAGNRINVSVTSYNHSQDGGIFGQSLAVWDGDDNTGSVIDFLGLANLDLTQNGTQEALEIEIISADLNSLITLTAYSSATNFSEYDLFLPGGSINQTYQIPFSSFVLAGGTGADFNDIGAITMLVDGSTVASLDVIIELLQTAPLLEVEKTDAIFVDVDGDNQVDVGDTIQYTVTISNPNNDNFHASVLNVVFNDTPDSNTALVVGSVTTSQGVVTTGNTGGDTSVSVNVGTVVDGATITITFDVVVTAETPEVCNQGFADSGLGNNGHPSDDPATQPTDDPTCTPVTFCGDGIVNDVTEECDDGNNNDNDACTNTCQNAECGDGIVQTGVEECDDGNLVNTDACTNACNNAECGDGIVQTGVEECDDGNLVNTDACTNACNNAECGDGIVQTGVEECDDGNLVNTDACTNACNNAECGDGFVQVGVEECDDGNLVDTDACTNSCNNAECGDGIVQTGVEECDDGNLVNTDACTNACNNAECGDGIVQVGVEECDDGNLVNTDSCTNACETAECGDGIVQTGVEECDDGNLVNTDSCTNACETAACGDGFVQPGEQCDDGNTNNNDGCSNTCALPECGDGIVQTPAEQCDDGNNDPGDGCSPTCQEEGCGNNVLDPGEECDGAANAACNGSLCGPNCTCQEGIIPTVSEWGLVMLTLLLLAGAKIAFGRQPRTA